jgi:hypothetical protein
VAARIENDEVVDPASCYFRIAPMFETAAANHDWINRVLAVGAGDRLTRGPVVYSVIEVL